MVDHCVQRIMMYADMKHHVLEVVHVLISFLMGSDARALLVITELDVKLKSMNVIQGPVRMMGDVL